MKITNYILFIIPSLIWGSTWYAITFQLGEVHPLISVTYRFGSAGLILLAFCIITQRKLKYSISQHIFIFLQGITLFSFNYWLVYVAEQTITSGLVSVIFSLIIFFNIFFSAVFLQAKIDAIVILGAVLGISGTALIFKKELILFNASGENYLALLFCLVSVIMASLGNIISARNQKYRIPVIQANALGMLYGALSLTLFALLSGIPFTFELRPSYIFSLAYLSIFGSVVAFSAYLKLLGNIGPGRSAYTILVVPLIAMTISTIFEGYEWQRSAIYGIILLLIGNYLAMNRRLSLLKRK